MTEGEFEDKYAKLANAVTRIHVLHFNKQIEKGRP